MTKLNIAIGDLICDLENIPEKEVDNIIELSKLLNIEFNTMVMNYGRINDVIALFFILFKNSFRDKKIIFEPEKHFLKFLGETAKILQKKEEKKIKNFIKDGEEYEAFLVKEQEQQQLINSLICANIIQLNKLKNNSNPIGIDENLEKYLNIFTGDILNSIQEIERNILL